MYLFSVDRADYQPHDARFKVVTLDIICLLIPLPTQRMCVGVFDMHKAQALRLAAGHNRE
jgi:hypothetical protein